MAHCMKLMFGLLNLNTAELHGNLTQSQRLEATQPCGGQKVNFLLDVYTPCWAYRPRRKKWDSEEEVGFLSPWSGRADAA